MASYIDIQSGLQFITADLSEQLCPAAFEHTLNHLIDQ